MSAPEIVDLFAGPGGWDEALRMLGVTDVIGVEWDAAACDTAIAAGHARILADVAAHPTAEFAGAVGLIASPPCQAWSMAGKRKGEADRANCHVLADRMAAGDDTTGWTGWEDDRSPLVCQPVRWVRDLSPQWVALEEVPAVASLWEHFARIFRGWGYSVWTGDLCAANFGVPQTRTRRILMAHKGMVAQPPEPTHAQHPSDGADLFGGQLAGWVSMATALGWTGGAVLKSRRDSDAWVESDGERPNRATTDPAPTFTGEAFRWTWERPATTVVGSFCPDVIAAPGYRTKTSRQNAPGSVKVTIAEAGVLQSFPADYPWAGSRSKQFEQAGNAIPPRLAMHILAALGVGTLAVEVAA